MLEKVILVSLIILGTLAGLIIFGALCLELWYRRRPGNQLVLISQGYQYSVNAYNHYSFITQLKFSNQNPYREVMVVDVQPKVKLLSNSSLEGVSYKVNIIPRHADMPARKDHHWYTYIVKPGKETEFELTIDIHGETIEHIQTAWIEVEYKTYGPEGYLLKVHPLIIPVGFPAPDAFLGWQSLKTAQVLPVPTHILTPLDDPVAVIKRYITPYACPGDIVALSETPLAIMQQQWRYYAHIKPGWLAKRFCQFFPHFSSMSSAGGMQALLEVSNPVRVIFAILVGAIAKKVFGIKGVFYQLAGEQARLIDDLPGNLPPFDQFIVLGPKDSQTVVNQIQQETGLSAAIVDVNNLKSVKVLAATSDVSLDLLEEALRDNPAGNGDEQTPLVLIRPLS